MNKTFDAVRVVRKIRDDIYAETKDMSAAELVEFFRRRGSPAKGKLRKAENGRISHPHPARG